MTPNNNLSVLPWYDSIEQQNARKWWTFGRIYPLFTPAMFLLPFQIIREHRNTTTITDFKVYTKDGVLVGTFTQQINEAGIYFKQFATLGYDVIVFPGLLPVFTQFADGQYYARISDGTQTWYSDVFTVVNDIAPYLKIEWWDDADFVMDAGRIVYTDPAFKNVAYLQAEIAKPEYVFEEDVEQRDGYLFPVKMISEKKYKFSFLASEYMLDVMRFIRMADHVKITNGGQVYFPDSFLLTPEWENEGDVAGVAAEFETNTVAKKLSLAYLREQQRGDFNSDFSNDFNNNE